MEFQTEEMDESTKKAIVKMAEKLHASAHPNEEFHMQIVEDEGLSKAVESSVRPLEKNMSYDSQQESNIEKKSTYGSAKYFAPIQVHCDHCAFASGAGEIIKEFMKEDEQYGSSDEPSSYDGSSGYDSGSDSIPSYDSPDSYG